MTPTGTEWFHFLNDKYDGTAPDEYDPDIEEEMKEDDECE